MKRTILLFLIIFSGALGYSQSNKDTVYVLRTEKNDTVFFQLRTDRYNVDGSSTSELSKLTDSLSFIKMLYGSSEKTISDLGDAFLIANNVNYAFNNISFSDVLLAQVGAPSYNNVFWNSGGQNFYGGLLVDISDKDTTLYFFINENREINELEFNNGDTENPYTVKAKIGNFLALSDKIFIILNPDKNILYSLLSIDDSNPKYVRYFYISQDDDKRIFMKTLQKR